jgi:hypothetical protein
MHIMCMNRGVLGGRERVRVLGRQVAVASPLPNIFYSFSCLFFLSSTNHRSWNHSPIFCEVLLTLGGPLLLNSSALQIQGPLSIQAC